MPKWKLEFQKSAERDLGVLDQQLRHRIMPLPLGGQWRGLFKLRVGDWRIAYEVNFSKKLISVHYIDRRDKIYKIKR